MSRSYPPTAPGQTAGVAAGRPYLRWSLVVVSGLGSADIAQFLVGGWASLAPHPGRLGGSILGLALWVLLMLGAMAGIGESDVRGRRLGMICLAAVLTLGSVVLVPIHLAAGTGGGRAIGGALLALLALTLAGAQVTGRPGRLPSPTIKG
ncbi:MAG: hypothetical protein ACYDC5_12425 [Candidatus Dormibacteria bacterium]